MIREYAGMEQQEDGGISKSQGKTVRPVRKPVPYENVPIGGERNRTDV